MSFEREGRASLWVCPAPLDAIPESFLAAGDAALCWLWTDYGIAVDGAFTENWSADRRPAPVAEVLAALHGAETFLPTAVRRARALGVERISFALGLYDFEYEARSGGDSRWLRYLGAFDYAGAT